MKNRRHHNNKGLRQIKRGKTQDQVERIAKKVIVHKGQTVGISSFILDAIEEDKKG